MSWRDRIANAITEGIRAFHGSPHNFTRFDASKIGTGEGAQAYGHGLYFAENPGVAESYKFAGQPGYVNPITQKTVQDTYDRISGNLRPGEDAITATRDALQRAYEMESNPHAKQRFADAMNNMGDFVGPNKKGKMYEVNINADPAHFLDWDKPLKQQGIVDKLPPEFLDQAKREAYNRALASTSKARADELWSMVKDPTNAPGGFAVEAGKYMRSPEISADLNSRGIPGIKYLDQGSRGAVIPTSSQHMYKPWGGTLDVPKPSSNYVMFPGTEDMIDIIRKYGIVGAPAGALGMGALADQSQYEIPP